MNPKKSHFEIFGGLVEPLHAFRYKTKNGNTDFSGCGWNFYILKKTGVKRKVYSIQKCNKIEIQNFLKCPPPAPAPLIKGDSGTPSTVIQAKREGG